MEEIAHRKGRAFPHCAAAKPRWLIKWRQQGLLEVADKCGDVSFAGAGVTVGS
jgi:hypothetical protein